MAKYVRRFRSLTSATNADDLVSPNLSHVEENTQGKLLMLNCGNDVPLKICGDSLETLAIKEKVAITYVSEHGVCPNDKAVCKGYALTSEDLPTLSESGWTFNGWNKTVGDIINENTTITASWESAKVIKQWKLLGDDEGQYVLFNYEDGMSWAQWINSNYNKNSQGKQLFYINYDRIFATDISRFYEYNLHYFSECSGLAANSGSWNNYDTINDPNELINDFTNHYYTGSYAYWSCYIKGTLISLSNNTFKKVEDITYNDDLLVWNFDKGKYDVTKPLWIKKAEISDFYWKCTFEDGSTINLVGHRDICHRIYNVTKNKFEYGNLCVGDEVYTHDGIKKMISAEIIEENVEFYNIITDYHLNVFADKVLTSCGFNNRYLIENMKFIKDDRESRSYTEFEKVGISEYWYNGMRLSEQTYPIEDIKNYIEKLERKMLPIE